MTVLWSDWFKDMAPHVPGCPAQIIEHELRRSAQEFFRRTRTWQVETGKTSVPPMLRQIVARPDDAGLEVVRVETVFYDDDKLTPTSASELDAMFGDRWEDHQTGKPDCWFSVTPNTVRFYPIPTASGSASVSFRLSVTPDDALAGLPDELAHKYREVVQTGAKSRLMLYPGASWSNPDMGLGYAQAFNAMSDRASADAARSFSNARVSSRPRWC